MKVGPAIKLNDTHKAVYESVLYGRKMTVYKVHAETNLKPSLIHKHFELMRRFGLLERELIPGKKNFYYHFPTDVTYDEFVAAIDHENSLRGREDEDKPDELLHMVETFTLTKQEYEFYRANKAFMPKSKIAKALRMDRLKLNAGIANYEKKIKESK